MVSSRRIGFIADLPEYIHSKIKGRMFCVDKEVGTNVRKIQVSNIFLNLTLLLLGYASLFFC